MAGPPFQPEDIWADFQVPGNPFSGAKEPSKSQIRAYDRWALDLLTALAGAGGLDPNLVPGLNARISLLSGAAAGYAPLTGSPGPLVDLTVGNAATAFGVNPAPSGNMWFELGTVLSDGAVTSLSAYIREVNSGAGSFLIAAREGDGFRPLMAIPVSGITAVGTITRVAGVDFPPIPVEAGWVIGWHSPAGGAKIAFDNGGGTGNTAAEVVVTGATYAATLGTAKLSLSATQRAAPNLLIGNPIVAGGQANAGNLWVMANDPFAGGWLTTLQAYIQVAGAGGFVILAPNADGTFTIESIIPTGPQTTGAKTFRAGVDFPTRYVPKGRLLGFWSVAGEAAIACAASGSCRSVTIGSIVVGQTVTVTDNGFDLALAATCTAPSQAFGRRIRDQGRGSSRLIGDLLSQVGTGTGLVARSGGNPLVPGTGPAPTRTPWFDTGTVLSDGTIDEMSVYINTVGDGRGGFVLVAPESGKYRVVAIIPVAGIPGIGPLSLYAGTDFDAIVVQSGWLLGWYAPAGGAQVAFGTGGSSLSLAGPVSLALNDLLTLTAGTALLSLAVRYRGVPDAAAGNPLIGGNGAPAANVWANAQPLVPGWLKSIQMFVSGAGNGGLFFALLSPLAGGSYKCEASYVLTGAIAGPNTWTVGKHFPLIYVQPGWIAATLTLTGGANVAFSVGANSSLYVARSSISAGDVVTLAQSNALFALSVSTTAKRPKVVERLAALESSPIFSPPSVRDFIASAAATISGSTVTVQGVLSRSTSSLSFAGSITLDAAVTGTVTDEAHVIAFNAVPYVLAQNRFANANVSAVVVKDASTSAVLIENTDYVVDYENGATGLFAAGTARSVKVSYAYSRRRQNLICLDPETLAISVVKGTDRVRDAGDSMPATPPGLIRLFVARVTAASVTVAATWEIEP